MSTSSTCSETALENSGSDFFDSIGRIVECRIFDVRSTLLRMSNIRHPKCLNSDIEHSMSAGCSLQRLTRHQTI